MKKYKPTNISESVNYLDKILSDEDKEFLKENGAISVHHSLGRWIRNEFGLWEKDSELCKNLVKLGFIHPDDMSNVIIETYIKEKLDGKI